MDLIKYFFITSYLLHVAAVLIFAEENLETMIRINNTEHLDSRLEKLRLLMNKFNISAYIVPNEDDHQTEDPAERDKRRQYISGFTGTFGDAVITMDNTTLWTDQRYYLQAEKQLPSYWTVMRVEDKSLPIEKWIVENVQEGHSVGIDPKKIIYKRWKELNESLSEHNIQLVAVEENLVDLIWENQPKYSSNPLFVYDVKYSGEPYESKLQRLRKKLNVLKPDISVVTKLDEIAWLLNLRGDDMPFSPLFISYALIGEDWAALYVDSNKVTPSIIEHLQKPEAKVEIKPYNEFWKDLRGFINSSKQIFIPINSNSAIHLMVPKDRLKTGESPLINMKAVKNEIEVEGARKAHIRDSVALCALFKKMEEEIPNGIQWDELKVAEVLDQFRKDYGENLYRGPSFKTIAAFGAHAALPHYVSSPDTNIAVDTSAAMTLDSGGQYLDGTIDTTRVLHFGNPTNFEIDIYTSLLQGVIDLADTVFPAAVPVSSLEILIRRPLFKLGLTFTHGITHGTGIFSNVHEDFNRTYFENFIGSQEPGYYLKDKLGMRLENLVVVVKAPVQNEANPAPLLTFSPLTLVPYELKLTNVSKLDFREISWLNNYHATVLEVVGNEMIKKGYQELYKWLEVKTKSVKKVCE